MKFDFSFLIIAGLLFLFFTSFEIYRLIRKKKKSGILFSDTRLLARKNFSKNILLQFFGILCRLLALALLLIALIRPQWGEVKQQISNEGIGIHMLIDRSSSMKQQMEYNGAVMSRLDVVKRVFKSFVLGDGDLLPGRPNDMIALSGFAFFADEYAPFTLDHRTLAGFANRLQVAEEYEDGTMIGDAIYQTVLKLVASEKNFREIPNGYRLQSKIMILLTDGEQTQGGMSPLQAAKFAKENNVKIYAIAIVPERNSSLSTFGGFFNFPAPEIDTSLVQKVAEITGGKFAKVSSGESLVSFYETIDRLEKTKIPETVIRWKDYFPELVGWAIGLLLLEQLILRLFLRKI